MPVEFAGQFRWDDDIVDVPGATAENAASTFEVPVGAGVDPAAARAVPLTSNGVQPNAWSGCAVTVTLPPFATQRVRELSAGVTTSCVGHVDPGCDGAGEETIGGGDGAVAPGDVDEPQAATAAAISPTNATATGRNRSLMRKRWISRRVLISMGRIARSVRFPADAIAPIGVRCKSIS